MAIEYQESKKCVKAWVMAVMIANLITNSNTVIAVGKIFVLEYFILFRTVFINIPHRWKSANVAPIYKKGDGGIQLHPWGVGNDAIAQLVKELIITPEVPAINNSFCTGALPPGDLFALGSKPTKPSESSFQKSSSSGNLVAEKKLSGLGDRKRESASLLAPVGVAKKPKILGQTFTPLGRPAERETEKRLSPVPPLSLAFEESAIEVRGLMAFCTLLKRDLSLNFKSKGNSLVSVLACNVLMKAYSDEDNWPDDFVKVYIDDALGERVWVDRADCKGFVDNIITAFNTNAPTGGISSLEVKTEPGSASPVVSIGEDEEIKMEVDSDKSSSSTPELQNVTVYPRYPYQVDNIETLVLEIIHDQLVKRQLMDASSKSLIKLMTATCGYGEVRQIAGQKLELWLQNPKLARASQELLMSVCMNCVQHDAGDMEVIAMLIKMRMKTKPLINHYLNCIRELLGQHTDNMRMVLTHTIYNELSTTRNPNNMALIGVVFTTNPENAAKILAEIFQDLLTNKDDYLRALRALFREIVRSLRYEINFSSFCLALMQERTESKFTDMEPAFKERYILAVTDLVCMCVLQAITPAVREAVTALNRGDKKDVEVIYSYQSLVAVIQRDAIWWLHTVVPKFFEPKQQEYVFCMRKMLFMESGDQYSKDNWPAEADRRYTPPQLAISNLYWKAWTILLIISAYNPTYFGKFYLVTSLHRENYPKFKSYKERVAQKEKQEILEFEGYLAASTTKVTITEANSLLIAQLTSMDPTGPARKPPQQIMDQLRSINDSLKIGQMLCRSRNPDFLLDIIQRQGTSQSMPWLAELVESSEGSLDVLPVQCLCEFLLHETQDVVKDGQDDESVKFEKHKRKQKMKKQQQLLSRLQTLVHDTNADSSTTHEVIDYFLKRLASTQAANRALATKGMSMIISRSQLSPTEEGPVAMEIDEHHQHNWLLVNFPALPMFPQVKAKTCAALRQVRCEDLYKELLETWFPEKGKPPSAYVLDKSEEALLLPDCLKFRMIRSNVEPLIDAALQDLQPSQLLLFVQTFGIPVHSMSKLLLCLDHAATVDSVSLEQSVQVLDKTYMAQLVEVQHKRGATGGDKFYSMLTDGKKLEINDDDEQMKTQSADDSMWKSQGHTDVVMETIPASHVVNMLLQAFDPSGRRSPDTETHFRSLIMSVNKRSSGALDVIKGFNEILLGSTSADFAKSVIHSTKACSLLRIIMAKQNEAGVKNCLHQTMERLSQYCIGQSSPMAAMVHQYMLSQANKKSHRSQLRTENQEIFFEDLKKVAESAGSKLESLVRDSMRTAMKADCTSSATQLACSVLLKNQTQSDSDTMLPSTCALFVDWLELLDPEIIRMVPELQRKKLAIGFYRYDPVSVLDFLWACIHVPKIWQGRERKLHKNQSSEDVLCLTGSQLVVLVSYIIQEATSHSCDSKSTNQIPATIRNRVELLKACVCDDQDKVKHLVVHIEKMLKLKSGEVHLYEAFLLELYLQYPYLSAWLTDSKCVTSEALASHNSQTQMDLISHRLITGLYQGNRSKRNDDRMCDVNIACRKLAAEHPVLVLRQLPAIVALLKGKTQFTFYEFKQRNLHTLYIHILGILELLQPSIFYKEHSTLNSILEEYFSLLTAYSINANKLMAPLIVKLVKMLNDYVNHDSQRASRLLQKHVLLLTNVSSQFPELSPLKSLLAGLTLPRHSQEEIEGQPVEAGSVVYPARSSSPWAASHLTPFMQKIKKDNSDEVLMVLQDLDETSKRKGEILEHFVDDLKRLMLFPNDQCRNTAFELAKRHIKQNPKQAVEFVPAFLHCLESEDPDIITSALTNLAEFTLLCQDYADVILQRALSAGINTSIETSSYISESLQLLNLDLAST
ncbi:integrator complex subunit 1-like [Ruditapes philippinarum]|uniref:integrator complex subunit 1-like n=1 Tax=Ruditapes philippinarum TaxID=129788 RepID=UPI00295BB5E6|nr:integrator complex subunit 1-like [Ruditapes philippinarum]